MKLCTLYKYYPAPPHVVSLLWGAGGGGCGRRHVCPVLVAASSWLWGRLRQAAGGACVWRAVSWAMLEAFPQGRGKVPQ